MIKPTVFRIELRNPITNTTMICKRVNDRKWIVLYDNPHKNICKLSGKEVNCSECPLFDEEAQACTAIPETIKQEFLAVQLKHLVRKYNLEFKAYKYQF